MFIAQEQASLGLVAEAYGNGRQCAVEAQADLQLHDRDRILAACKAIEQDLHGRVARVAVTLPSRLPPGTRVSISGEVVDPTILESPYVVSPGRLVVEVVAPEYRAFRKEIDVAEGATIEVPVTLAPDPAAQPCGPGQERVDGACLAACTAGRVRAAGGGG